MNGANDKWKMELKKAIALLNQTLNNLQALVLDPEEAAERDFIMLEIQAKIDKLEEILAHLEASEVVIPGVSPEAAAVFNEKMEELNREIEREKKAKKILQIATDILDVASKVVTEAQKI